MMSRFLTRATGEMEMLFVEVEKTRVGEESMRRL